MSKPLDFILRSEGVVLPAGVAPAAIWVREGKIAAILSPGEPFPPEVKIIEEGDAVISPGVVDTHAHINEPGRTEWEGFETATRAAAAGGTTTVIDMPLNSIPPTTTLEGFHAKAREASGRCWIDYGFWGGVVPGNSRELEAMAGAGVLGFKAFLIDSGVPEFGFVGAKDLSEAMPILARLGLPLLAHAELRGDAPTPPTDHRHYSSYLASRPRDWENRAIQLLISLARETRCRVHVVHLSSADALPDLARAKSEGVPITVETCPHYLTFCAEEIPEGATHFKCAPPIRERENRERLWEGLTSGVIDFIVSDHSPCTPALKLPGEGDFHRAWGGIASLQFTLSVIWTEARRRGIKLECLSAWLSERPARFAGLSGRKGKIAVGMDADLVVWNPDERFTVEPHMVRHRHSVTPYAGRTLDGVVKATYVRGEPVTGAGRPAGRMVRNERA